MSSNATAAFGTLLKVGDGGGPEVFTAIAEVKDIAGPQLSTDTEEVTHHQSVRAFEEFVATIKRTGEVTFPVNWLPNDATQDFTTGIGNDYDDRTKRNFQLVYASSPTVTWAFAAFVTGYEPAAEVAGVLEGSITLKLTGAVTF